MTLTGPKLPIKPPAHTRWRRFLRWLAFALCPSVSVELQEAKDAESKAEANARHWMQSAADYGASNQAMAEFRARDANQIRDALFYLDQASESAGSVRLNEIRMARRILRGEL